MIIWLNGDLEELTKIIQSNSTIKYDKNEDSVYNSEDISAAKLEETKKRRQSFKIKGKNCQPEL